MEAQSYINKFEVLDPKTAEITHNLDKFRPLFVGHPGNYVDIYATAFGINDPAEQEDLRQTTWLTVPNARKVEGRNIAINRTQRWLPPQLSPLWKDWKEQGVVERAFFLGLEEEYQQFKKDIGWDIPYQKTQDMLELAEYIEGADVFIGNQSLALSLAIGLGHQDVWAEMRKDLPLERNECYFKDQPGVNYF
jgi:hypothetical protein